MLVSTRQAPAPLVSWYVIHMTTKHSASAAVLHCDNWELRYVTWLWSIVWLMCHRVLTCFNQVLINYTDHTLDTMVATYQVTCVAWHGLETMFGGIRTFPVNNIFVNWYIPGGDTYVCCKYGGSIHHNYPQFIRHALQ